MYLTLKQKHGKRIAKVLPKGVKPIRVEWDGKGNPATVKFSDGKESLGSCIRCFNPPCMEYSSKELHLAVFQDFPADKNNAVCPTSAITWPQDSQSPIINSSICILCGLCVSRCPVRAIHLNEKGAYLNDEPSQHFLLLQKPTEQSTTSEISTQFKGIYETGVYLFESDKLMHLFRTRFEKIAEKQTAQFPNHLVRNLLIESGVGAAMRRRGDTNVRMDLVLGPPGVKHGTAEVELGAEVLDAPRNILDNIAVLVGRYGLSKDSIVPIIISLELPNQRSEYWQFIRDIRDVLRVKINSLTVGALAVIVWNRKSIMINTGDECYVDVEQPSLRSKLIEILERDVNIKTLGYPGFLESLK